MGHLLAGPTGRVFTQCEGENGDLPINPVPADSANALRQIAAHFRKLPMNISTWFIEY
jgi:hypothetical protein